MVNPINFTPSVNPNVQVTAKQEIANNQTPSAADKKPATNYQNPEDVLNYMSQNSNPGIANQKAETAATSRTIEVSKYVSPEQAKRIGSFVNEFESSVTAGLKQFEKEFGSMPEYQGMSNAAKQEMAVQLFNKQNMPDIAE